MGLQMTCGSHIPPFKENFKVSERNANFGNLCEPCDFLKS